MGRRFRKQGKDVPVPPVAQPLEEATAIFGAVHSLALHSKSGICRSVSLEFLLQVFTVRATWMEYVHRTMKCGIFSHLTFWLMGDAKIKAKVHI